MQYRIAPLFCRPWTLNGISARLIESHYEHNYGSALTRLNAVTEELKRLDIKATPARVISRLKQEQTMLLNSTLLHELYFASLGGDGRSPTEIISVAIAFLAQLIGGEPSSSPSRKASVATPGGYCSSMCRATAA
jgi:Fe-Mn family superoxide dismutase